ncbi:SAM-dependent methyltransferase [Pseudonocardia sp. ICBG1293]|uniref:SAM-dependent methyltransferase n=1 Tax=Pseudonocardia sp. ICBG1293 TaxID=2844382 RepID=UPI001CCE940C|nr:SAM-dependent methyltransferase [Pseudonocardia sp. ICBG1293]
MTVPEPAPDPGDEIDLTLPNPARVYDFMLGGAHNFATDREFAEKLLAVLPDTREVALANRAFLGRAVRACLDRGVRQFLDLGSGIPTAAPVHEIAHRADPAARVAYVDVEAVSVAMSRRILAGVDGTSITAADLTDVDAVLTAPGVADLLDPAEPVAVLAVSVLHFVRDDELLGTLFDRYATAFGPGSMLVVSHGSTDVDDPAAAERMRTIERFTQDSAQPARARDRAQLRHLLVDRTGHRLELLEPGLVDVSAWRPEDGRPPVGPAGMYAVVGEVVPRRGDGQSR